MKKGALTIDKMEELYLSIAKNDDSIIKWWQYPFLWVLFFFTGYIIESEHWKMYIVNFRGATYLIRSDEKK